MQVAKATAKGHAGPARRWMLLEHEHFRKEPELERPDWEAGDLS